MRTKTLLAHKKLWLTLAVAWTLLIAVLCLVSFNKLPTVKIAGADKYVHAVFHFVFTLLWFAYLRIGTPRPLLKVFVGSLAYGALMEVLQGVMTTTRQADMADIMANLFGATVAVLIILTTMRYAPVRSN
ncbi:VanZ family protein [Flavobacterium caeni]|uniref:VanZ family protein n=1 Tax=Flavobacterium caeni TaxID=490189 RepID=UPI0011131A26|nr:VanZ family protein [Flavobacterium caeni]